MKIALALLLTASLFAADKPAQKLKDLTVEQKLEISNAQLSLTLLQAQAEQQFAPIRAQLQAKDAEYQSLQKKLLVSIGADPGLCKFNDRQQPVCETKASDNAVKPAVSPSEEKPSPAAAKPAND